MLCGTAIMFIEEKEMIHALNEYFYHQVRDGGLSPYATVVGVRQQRGREGLFVIELEGKTPEPKK